MRTPDCGHVGLSLRALLFILDCKASSYERFVTQKFTLGSINMYLLPSVIETRLLRNSQLKDHALAKRIKP